MMSPREYVLYVAQSCLGAKEGTTRHKTIVDIYNQYSPKNRPYKLTMQDPWCAAFVSSCFIAAGHPGLIPIECSCWMMKKMGTDRGMLRDKTRFIPRPGDIVFYKWKGNSQVSHVGIVSFVAGSRMEVIEGNYNDKVGIRKIKFSYPYIDSYLEVNYG